MKLFGQILPKDYTISEFKASSTFSWRLQSSSLGITTVTPDIDQAVTVNRAVNAPDDYYSSTPPVNVDTGIYEYVLYSSINHIFYSDVIFASGSQYTTSSVSGLADNSYVISIGQDFYGDRIKPNSFELQLNNIPTTVIDDGFGNLITNPLSGTGSYVGNIFYDNGIAVIKENSGSVLTITNNDGIKILNGTNVYIDYASEVDITRHEINVKIRPSEFNMSFANPSIQRTFSTASVPVELQDSASLAIQMIENLNVPQSSSGEYTVYSLMAADIIKPYITTIGLYDDKNQLLAVAKLSSPVQRTYESDQTFIVRFDVVPELNY